MPRLLTSTKLKLAYVAIAAADTWLVGSTSPTAHKARAVTKPLLMPTLAASLITDPRAADSPLRTTTLLAQAGGWGGDVALLGDDPKNFVAGAASFAAGHAAYISGFRAHRNPRLRRAPRIVAGLCAATAPMVIGAAKQEKVLGPTLAGYSAMLTTTFATSTQLDRSIPRSARRLSIAGAAMFVLSDSLLGTRKFLLKNPPRQLEQAVMATYTAAQLLLSEGAARAGSDA